MRLTSSICRKKRKNIGAILRIFNARNRISRLLDKRNFESKIAYKKREIGTNFAIMEMVGRFFYAIAKYQFKQQIIRY